MLGLAQLIEPDVGLAPTSVQFPQEKVIRMLHDFDDGDGCLQLLDREVEIRHGGQFGSLVEVDVRQEVQAFV